MSVSIIRSRSIRFSNAGFDAPVSSIAYHNARPAADLMCLTPQAVAERRPKTAAEIALGLASSRLKAARIRRAALSSAESRSRRHPIPLIFIQQAAEQSSRRPVVIALAQSGKEAFLAARHGDIAALLKRGIAVCLADVRGTGETAARNSYRACVYGVDARQYSHGRPA
jgi:hypothetical protein